MRRNIYVSLLTSSVLSIASRILPIAVLEPTPITTALALPATTTVPCETTAKKNTSSRGNKLWSAMNINVLKKSYSKIIPSTRNSKHKLLSIQYYFRHKNYHELIKSIVEWSLK
jgi:hypothetical protein